MNIRTFILFLVVGVLFFSCTKEEIDNRLGNAAGDATRITLALKSERQQLTGKQGMALTNRAMQFLYGVPTTGSMIGSKTFSPQDESLITNVHILVFDPTGKIVSNNYIGKLNFSEIANIVSETYCGENMNVWVVANGDVNDTEETPLNTELQKIKSINDLQTLLISTKENGLSRPDRLTMVGNTTINIAPNMKPISIQMYYLAAKVTVNVTDNTPADVEITITGWDVVNIPKRTYLKERIKEDAVNGTVSADYLTTAGEYPFETISTKSWAQSFYLFENRRGNRVDRALPTNPSERYPGMSVSDNNQRGKAWYAPPGATYMLIYGTYSMNEQKNNVVYKIYLGENAHNNYDVVRGKHYTFNVSIKGLNQIDIDTTVDWGNSSFTVTPHGDLEKMDAHPDFRVLRIGATAVDATTPGYATVEVLNNDNTPCLWLSVSPLNLYRHGIKQSGNQNQPLDEAVGRFVRTEYNPTVADELSFGNATFGMTRKLNEIPFPQLAVLTFQDIIIYADEFDGTGDRKAKVRVTYYKDENGTSSIVGQQEFDVAQQDAIKISNDLYMERYEESAMMLQPGIPSNLQGTATAQMQWGYSSEVLYGNTDRYTDGAFLTANAVYKNVKRGNNLSTPTWSPITSYTSYRDLYPRTGEKVNTPSSLQTESVYYYPALSGTTAFNQYFDPIYNSSAARYCHEKNRDTDGNGIVDADESIWYLPSLADIIYINAYKSSDTNLSGTSYWTSTEDNSDNSWAYTFPASPETKDKTATYRVRCVRGKGIVMPEATFESTENDKTQINLNYTAGSNGIFTVSDITNLPWTVSSSDPSWLTITTSELGANSTDSKTESGNKSYWVYATENTSFTALRTTPITLTRQGMPDKTITVMQKKVSQAEIKPKSLTMKSLAGSSQPFTIDDKGSGISWTVTSTEPWMAISTFANGANAVKSMTGTGKANLYAIAQSSNPNTDNTRQSNIAMSQNGTLISNIDATQEALGAYQPTMHGGWAGCNIYWDDQIVNEDGSIGRLTFDDINVSTHVRYTGVCFVAGSLVALCATWNVDAQPRVLFSSGPAYDDEGLIPYAGKHVQFLADNNRHFVLEYHNPEKSIGDICYYMSQRGWAPGSKEGKKWRMPTNTELNTLVFKGQVSANYWTGTNIYGQEVVNEPITGSGSPAHFYKAGIGGIALNAGSQYVSASPGGGTPDSGSARIGIGHDNIWMGTIKNKPFPREATGPIRCVVSND